jgi:hypothetical protein
MQVERSGFLRRVQQRCRPHIFEELVAKVRRISSGPSDEGRLGRLGTRCNLLREQRENQQGGWDELGGNVHGRSIFLVFGVLVTIDDVLEGTDGES